MRKTIDLPNLRHLAATVEVYRRGSMSAAASAVHMTQPAVTQAVLGLESAMGGRLFERSPQGVVATAAGRRAGPRLERVLEQLTLGLTEAGVMAVRRDEVGRRVTATQCAALVSVVEAGGIAAAARATDATRATLHRPVRDLEAKLRVSLLEATSHGIRATRAAARLARRVRLAQGEWVQAQAELAAQRGEDAGATVIGAMPLARSVVVPAAVLAFATRVPRHRVEILDGSYESLLEALRQGRADWLVGALRPDVPDDVVQAPLFDDPLVVVARAGHPLVGRTGVSRRILRAEAWVAPRVSSPLRQRFDDLIGAQGPVSPIECNSFVAGRALLLSSERLMWASAHQVRRDLQVGLLGIVAHPFGRLTRTIGITRRRDWVPTRAQEDLLRTLNEESAKAQAACVPA